MSGQKDGMAIGFLRFVGGVGVCMFLGSIGLIFRGGDMAVVVICGAIGLGTGICMKWAIERIRARSGSAKSSSEL
jgi:cyanate permease